MVQAFANRYKKLTASILFLAFYLQSIILPLHAAIINYNNSPIGGHIGQYTIYSNNSKNYKHQSFNESVGLKTGRKAISGFRSLMAGPEKSNIGGPNSPEASSFKAVGSDNLVNLFTGDFSYSIPLLDVGGYPVNLFYSGGIGMEQEASWVGLGWNINPGSITRNLRGVPDDFNGTDTLIQKNNMKPNKTIGGEIGINGEALGIPRPKLNFSLGMSINNYLGPELELGAGISLSIPIAKNIFHEKAAPQAESDTAKKTNSFNIPSELNFSANAKLSSRSGLALSPSLNLFQPLTSKKDEIGFGVSTSYNSRTGIKNLNLSIGTNRHLDEKVKNEDDQGYNLKGSIGNTTISFARPTYIPTLRMPLQYSNYSGQLEGGGGMFGIKGGFHMQGYKSFSEVPLEWQTIKKPLVGFIYSENAYGNKNAVMDLSRLGDAEVTPNTPIVSAPQYAYDVFSIQGEGTGGTIRAYRSELGFMRDNETISKDKNISLGFDIAPGGHFGGNWNIINTPTRSGGWDDNNNTLRQTIKFNGPSTSNSSTDRKSEHVYFRNPGEATVINQEMIDRLSGDDVVRFKLSGSSTNPRLESVLQSFSKKTLTAKGDKSAASVATGRDKRTQLTTFFTAKEASEIGLEKDIKSYNGLLNTDTTLQYTSMPRIDNDRKAHHISEIDVLEQSGMRYVYGLPVYNLVQKDYTFSVAQAGDLVNGIVNFSSNEDTTASIHMADNSKIDGYFMSQSTPAYASAFLLTGLLSPDYVDITGNGITEDDLGTAVKFNYNKAGTHKWRTPRAFNGFGNTAHFNDGLRSEKKDNKATISYGEREVWYLNSIESKSMIAIFKTEARSDSKGVMGQFDGTINSTENANKRLRQIDLYTKAELRSKGIVNARPIKSVVFEYDYSLCNFTPDNSNGGKLTLKSVYFVYNGQSRFKKDRYVFGYGNNPSYARNASDRWGTYKDPETNINVNSAANPAALPNSDYPYTSKNKQKNDEFASAWNLNRILLPSGAQMNIEYEADDYGYVQDRRACNMFKIYGVGQNTTSTENPTLYSNGLLQSFNNGLLPSDNFYVYVSIPQPISSSDTISQKAEIKQKYLESLNQLAFKLLVEVPAGEEFLTSYADIENWGVCPNSYAKNIIYLKLKAVDGKSPLAKSTIGFVSESLPDQAFPGYKIEETGIEAFLKMAGGMIYALKNAFKNVDEQMRSASIGRTINLDKSFVRLANPYKIKYGGGYRVKKITLKDNWQKMLTNNGQVMGYTSIYGQEYDYTATEKVNGAEVSVSSGVASYEPAIGSEENPFREIISFSNKMPLASAQYGAIEMPMLDGLYPAPIVGYSKVTVRSINRTGTQGPGVKVKSDIGKQVTEYYTAKDYPTFSTNTSIDAKEYHFNSFFNIFYKEIYDRKVLSQGFLVETNDMHGRIKSQTAYSAKDEKNPVSYSMHFYKNTGKNGMNDKVDFINNKNGGAVESGNMGIDMELMTDVREFSVKTKGFNGQIQTDFFSFWPPWFLIPMLPLKTNTENIYRAVTCTKMINYHAIEDSVIVMDKGSVVTTKTIAYDIETGAAVVTKTANEFKDPIYNINYPAYWAYSGMEPAYKNIGREFRNVSFLDGKINLPFQNDVFESGDELYIYPDNINTTSPGCVPITTGNPKLLWAFDRNKTNSPLTVQNKDLIFITDSGYAFTRAGVSARIVRSGKRNLLGNFVASVATMANPIVNGMLAIDNNSKVVSASALEFKEKWQNDWDVFRRVEMQLPPIVNLIANGNFSQGNSSISSQYVYNTSWGHTGGYEGYYTVTTNPHLWDLNFSNCTDHTTGTGNMMVVNGATSLLNGQPKIVWTQTVIVQAYTNYLLSFFVQQVINAGSQYYPNISVKINGVEVDYRIWADGLCNWKQFAYSWNSGTSTTATIAIYDNNLAAYANDFALDDISFGLNSCAIQAVPVFSCGGTPEIKINPYKKGIIGVYRVDKNYVFYGSRVEADPTVSTSIRKNGYIADYANYWQFSANSLIPNSTNAKWINNDQITKFNSKGQELETKNALNQYTAAQIGFSKSLTTSVTQNARFGESMAESFEDIGFNDKINPGSGACTKSYTGFDDNVSVANNVSHTGANSLSVQPNSTYIKSLPVNGGYLDDFNFLYKNTYLTTPVSSPVGNVQLLISVPNPMGGTPTVNFTGTSASYNFTSTGGSNIVLQYNSSSNISEHKRFYNITQYIKNLAPNVYTFNLHSQHAYDNVWNGNALFARAAVSLSIEDLNGNRYINGAIAYSDVGTGDNTVSVYLPCGEFIFTTSVSSDFTFSGNLSTTHAGLHAAANWTSNMNSISGFTSACQISLPIPATDSMMNPTFQIVKGKKMYFSAWVKEHCPITPCNRTDFAYSNVQIWANGTQLSAQDATISRTGGIIEGWQKIEGEFTLPPGTNSSEIRFVNNNSSGPMYIDDIRIHPFNANMKSYVYDPRTLKLSAELDENNYATIYQYDEEGQLVRVKKETSLGIKTIKETRSAKQTIVTDVE